VQLLCNGHTDIIDNQTSLTQRATQTRLPVIVDQADSGVDESPGFLVPVMVFERDNQRFGGN
jgi:hypothetical protein